MRFSVRSTLHPVLCVAIVPTQSHDDDRDANDHVNDHASDRASANATFQSQSVSVSVRQPNVNVTAVLPWHEESSATAHHPAFHPQQMPLQSTEQCRSVVALRHSDADSIVVRV